MHEASHVEADNVLPTQVGVLRATAAIASRTFSSPHAGGGAPLNWDAYLLSYPVLPTQVGVLRPATATRPSKNVLPTQVGVLRSE